MENEESHAMKLKLHNIVPSGFDGGVHTRIVRLQARSAASLAYVSVSEVTNGATVSRKNG